MEQREDIRGEGWLKRRLSRVLVWSGATEEHLDVLENTKGSPCEDF